MVADLGIESEPATPLPARRPRPARVSARRAAGVRAPAGRAGARARPVRRAARAARAAGDAGNGADAARRGRDAEEAPQPPPREASLMGALVWVMIGLAIWHFTIFLPDRFWGGIVGAFLGALARLGHRRASPSTASRFPGRPTRTCSPPSRRCRARSQASPPSTSTACPRATSRSRAGGGPGDPSCPPRPSPWPSRPPSCTPPGTSCWPGRRTPRRPPRRRWPAAARCSRCPRR